MLTCHNPYADADAQLTPQQASALLPYYKSEEGTAVSRGRETTILSSWPLYQVRETGKVHFEMASSLWVSAAKRNCHASSLPSPPAVYFYCLRSTIAHTHLVAQELAPLKTNPIPYQNKGFSGISSLYCFTWWGKHHWGLVKHADGCVEEYFFGCRCNLNWLKLIVKYLSEKNKPSWGTREDIFPTSFPSVFLRISSMLLPDLVFVI